MKFEIIVDKLVSKKNDVEVYCRNGFPIKYKSQKIRDFEIECVCQLKEQKIKKKVKTYCQPVKVSYLFELTSRITIRDKDNMETSVNDVLQQSGILENDALIYRSCSEKKLVKQEKERAVIEIELLDKETKMS